MNKNSSELSAARTSTNNMAGTEVKAVTTSNGVGACVGTGVGLDSVDVRRKRYSLSSITVGLWELAVKSAISIASARKKNAGDSAAEGSVPIAQPQPLALPPLPAVPPVGPARRRPRSQSLSHTQSLSSALPPFHPASPSSRVLTRSQSMADVFSAMVAAKLKPAAAGPTFVRSTHCQECNQRFSLIFRRHHCRMCQRSVCAYCSTYQRVACDMAEETESEVREEAGGATSPLRDGDGTAATPCGHDVGDVTGRSVRSASSLAKTTLHRVCRKCASDMEGKKTGLHRSWTDEFVSLRNIFKQGRQTGGVFEETHLLPPRIPRMPKVCEPIAASFLEECRKNSTRHYSQRFLTASASFNSGLQYALKPPDQKLCHTCSRLLRFPVERKTCALCEEIYCRNCSSRDLALTLPDDLDPGDVGHEIAQVGVRVLSKEEAEEMDKNSNTQTGSLHGACVQRYRVCHDCREHVQHVMKVMNFNDKLAQLQAELVDLQEQIVAVLDDQDTPSPGIGLTRWPSVRSVTTYKCAEDEIVGEAVSYRVAQKLLERYFRVFLELERLTPETVTQSVLIKHVKQAMSNFYMTRRSLAARRFNRRESLDLVTLPSAPHYL